MGAHKGEVGLGVNVGNDGASFACLFETENVILVAMKHGKRLGSTCDGMYPAAACWMREHFLLDEYYPFKSNNTLNRLFVSYSINTCAYDVQ